LRFFRLVEGNQNKEFGPAFSIPCSLTGEVAKLAIDPYDFFIIPESAKEKVMEKVGGLDLFLLMGKNTLKFFLMRMWYLML